MKRLKHPLGKLPILLLLLFAACAGSNEDRRRIVEREPIIPETTKVPDQATRDAQTAYNADTGEMRFSTSTPILDNLKPGDVFVSEPSTAAPYGYLRRVMAIRKNGSEVVLQTTQAKLTDAIHQGTLNVEGEIKPSQLLSITPLSEGASGRALASTEQHVQVGKSASFDFEAAIDSMIEVKAEDPEGEAEATAWAKFSGLVKFNVGYRVLADIGLLADLNWAEAAIVYNQSVSISVEADVEGSVTKELQVARFDFSPITIFIGPVPIVIVPSAKVVIGVKGEARLEFDYKFTQNASFEQGLRWHEDEGFKKIERAPFAVKHEGPHFQGTGSVSAYTRATMRLLFYGVGGPDFGATVGAKFEVKYPYGEVLWRLFGFIAGDVAFTLDVLGEELRYDEDLFEIQEELAREEAKPPTITILNPRPTADLFADIDLGQFFDITDQVGFTYTLSSDRDGPLGTSTGDAPFRYKFMSDGRRTVAISARSATGKTSQAFFTLDVVNTPPDLPALYDEVNLTVGEGDEFDLNLKSPYDKNSGTLGPEAVRWVVDGTDSLVRQPGDYDATAIFGSQGTRTVKAVITDPQGLSSERTFNIIVTPPPAIKSPTLGPIEVFDSGGGRFNRDGLVYYGSSLTASISVASNPSNVPIAYGWLVENVSPQPGGFPNYFSQTSTATITAGQEVDTVLGGIRTVCGGGTFAVPAKAALRVEVIAAGRSRFKTFNFSCAPRPPN